MRSAVVAASEAAAPSVGNDHGTPNEARRVLRELAGAETFDLPAASTEESPYAARALRESVGRAAARPSQGDAQRSRDWSPDGRRGDRSRRCGSAPRYVGVQRLGPRG